MNETKERSSNVSLYPGLEAVDVFALTLLHTIP